MHLFRRGTSSLFGSSNVSLASSKTDATTDALGDDALAADGFQSVLTSEKLFTKVDPAVDGEECLHDCATCTVKYPAKFDIDFKDELYGQVKGWATHVLVATDKSDWVRDVADEQGSLMEAIEKGGVEPSNGVGRFTPWTGRKAHNSHGFDLRDSSCQHQTCPSRMNTTCMSKASSRRTSSCSPVSLSWRTSHPNRLQS